MFFFEGTVVFVSGRDGIVAALDLANISKITITSLGTLENVSGGRLYSTKNSACVQGKRVFVTTGWTKPGFGSWGNTTGRLYAVDVNPDAQNQSDILKVAWNFSFPGQSQASPTLIGDTLYFDGFNGTTICFPPPPKSRDPHIYAVYTNGTLRWKRSYPNITCFSFSMDPRGGFWYEDLCLPFQGGGGRKLVHFNENGTINESIDMETLLDDTGPFKNFPVYPCSCMTVCGTAAHPVMIVSANHDFFGVPGRWVVAINLSDNDSLLWKVPIISPLGFNYAGGQFTILRENNQSRVLFGTFLGGVMAIGTTSGWDLTIYVVMICIIFTVIAGIIVWFVVLKRKHPVDKTGSK
jgi:hypothetical protein